MRLAIKIMKDFWKHANGKIYAIESDTFGRIIGAAGPLDFANLNNLEDYKYKPGIKEFVANAIAHHKLRRCSSLSMKAIETRLKSCHKKHSFKAKSLNRI